VKSNRCDIHTINWIGDVEISRVTATVCSWTCDSMSRARCAGLGSLAHLASSPTCVHCKHTNVASSPASTPFTVCCPSRTYPRAIKGFIHSALPKLDLTTDAENIANLVNVNMCL